MRAAALQREIDHNGIACEGGLSWFNGHWTSRKSSGQAIIPDIVSHLDRHSPGHPCSCYPALVNPTLSPMTVVGPMGSGSGLAMLSFSNSILLFHTFLKKSSKTWIVNCSAGQRRYPKPNGAKPA